jgi:iron complex transport system substrate-binding protein
MSQRIVSLLPSATEIVCALGLEDELVAITHECDYPPSVRSKPVVTASVLSNGKTSSEIDRHIRHLVHQGSSIYTLDVERLQALEPDLILTQELCDVCAVSYPIVEQAVRRMDGPTQVVSLEPESLVDVYRTIRSVGGLTNRVDEARGLTAALAERVASIQSRVSGKPIRRTVCLEWVDPPYNCGHWTPELVAIAGGEDLLGVGGRPAKPIEDVRLPDLGADVVVVMACGFGLERSLEEVRRATPAVNGAELWVVDGNAFFSRPGPRLVDSLEIMAGILHPEAVAPPAPNAARRLA